MPRSGLSQARPSATMRALPSPTSAAMRDRVGSHNEAASSLPMRKLVPMTSMDWFRYSAGLTLYFSKNFIRYWSEALPLGAAMTLPFSHWANSSLLLNCGASLRTSTREQRVPSDMPSGGDHLDLGLLGLGAENGGGHDAHVADVRLVGEHVVGHDRALQGALELDFRSLGNVLLPQPQFGVDNGLIRNRVVGLVPDHELFSHGLGGNKQREQRQNSCNAADRFHHDLLGLVWW